MSKAKKHGKQKANRENQTKRRKVIQQNEAVLFKLKG
jgi:hypothetical protein